MPTLPEVLEKARSLKFDRITTGLRVNRKSSSVMIRFWRGEVTIHKIQVTAISPVRVLAEAAHLKVIEDVRAGFPGVPVNGKPGDEDAEETDKKQLARARRL